MKNPIAYRCVAANPYVYVGDVVVWDPVFEVYRSVMSSAESWGPSVMRGPEFKKLRAPKFLDRCRFRMGDGVVLSYTPRNQVHPPMVTVAYESPGSSDGYATAHVRANQVEYVDSEVYHG